VLAVEDFYRTVQGAPREPAATELRIEGAEMKRKTIERNADPAQPQAETADERRIIGIVALIGGQPFDHVKDVCLTIVAARCFWLTGAHCITSSDTSYLAPKIMQSNISQCRP
jgi:hypothetical protein